ncbi:MAG TPA: ParB/RepB/Spo0J family partition protein [Thermoguttaceae bacterium]|nr:ParB/RepB/Spo0J family partition protein [Thermoguttaceae bacterium]
MSKERRLGRGLEALLGRVSEPAATPPPITTQGLYGANDNPYENSIEPTEPPTNQSAVGAAEPMPAEHRPHPNDENNEHVAFEEIDEDPASAEPATLKIHTEVSDAGQAPGVEPSTSYRIDVAHIDSNPDQPRQHFDAEALQTLRESIESHGLLQPVVVRKVDDDRYQLVAGERRLRAAIQAGWADVPANVIEADDRESAELAIVENLQRKDLNPLEKAASFQRYLEVYGCTQEELAKRLKIDRSTIANLIRLLELPEPVQQAVRQAKLTQGHARALLPLGEEVEQIRFAERIQQESLSVRQTEALVQETIEAADREDLGPIDGNRKNTKTPRVRSDHLAALEQELRTALGTKVHITHNARGRGKMVIHFNNHEEFERLRSHLCHPGGPAMREAS